MEPGHRLEEAERANLITVEVVARAIALQRGGSGSEVVLLRKVLVAIARPQLEAIVQRLQPSHFDVGGLVRFGGHADREIHQHIVPMSAIPRAEGKPATARHSTEAGIPTIHITVQPLHQLMVVGPPFGFLRKAHLVWRGRRRDRHRGRRLRSRVLLCWTLLLSLIHISEPTRLLSISYAVF